MNSNFLFPSKFKKIGWAILIPSLLLAIPCLFMELEPAFLDLKVFTVYTAGFMEESVAFGFIQNNVFNEILGVTLIISSLFVAFSKEPDEDELITKLRLQCLVWATYWNYGILLLAMITVYDLTFYWVMLFNMFTILFLFIIRFNWLLMKMRKSLGYEE